MKRIFFMGIMVLASFLGCRQYEIVVDEPEFDVVVDKLQYKANDQVVFNFKGNPDIITFFSGEVKKEYKYREGRIVPPGKLTMSFNSSTWYGTRQNQLTLFVSTDFNGNYTSINDVKAATWTPITNRAVLGTSSTYVPSGNISLDDLVVDGKPMYILFKYIDDPSLPGTPNNCLIQNFKVNSETVLGVEQVIGLTGWKLIYEGPKDPARSSISTATITLRNNNPPGDYTVDWCISAPITTGAVNLGPDRPIAIKGSKQTDMLSYVYEYTKPGTYEAYFVAKNANIKGSKEVVKKIELTITP